MRSAFKFAPVAIVFFMFFMLSSGVAKASEGTDAFGRGVSAFRAGDYQIALSEFLRARHAGIDSANLRYDLGATYFKLGRYRESAQEFKALAKIRQLAALAHYNLGLIALKQKRPRAAESEFRLVTQLSGNGKINALAREQLYLLNPTASKHFAPWVGFANVGGGYNTDVSLLSRSSLISAAGRGSVFAQLLAGAIGQLEGTPGHGLRFISTFYHINYPSLNFYNQTLLRVGLAYRRPLSGWDAEVSAYTNYSYLHGNPFEQFNSLGFDFWHPFARDWQVHIKYRYSHITGSNPYAYLTGDQQQLGVQARRRYAKLDMRLGYALALNRRADLSVGNSFYSASPTRNEIYARANWPVMPRTKVFIHVSYQLSRYNSPDITLQGTNLVSETRVDRRYLEAVGARYRLLKGWYFVGEFQHAHADSTLSVYSYDSDLYSLQVEHIF